MKLKLNGAGDYIGLALELPRQLDPQGKEVLRLGRNAVYLGLAEEKERPSVEESLTSGWEERPAQTCLYNQLALRVTLEEHRRVLARAEPYRIFLPEPLPEPPEDREFNALILGRTVTCTAAETALAAVQGRLDDGLLQLHKLRAKKADTAVLRAQLSNLKEDVQAARDQADKERSRLAQLLQIRADRRRAFALAESTVK